MIGKKIKSLCLIMAVIMVLTCALSAGISVSAATSEAGHVVYFDNSVTNYPQVYAYMWKDYGGSNAEWPGELMTQLTDTVWGYTIKGNYDKIIFTQGDSSGQSDNLDYPGNGMIAVANDNGRFQATWSEYTGAETLPTVETTATESTSTTATETTQPATDETVEGTRTVYCQNDKGWSTVNVYMWNGNGTEQNAQWPGVKMDSLGDGLYVFEYEKYYENVIFNDGSSQTGDMVLPGNSYCYNNSTQTWEYYIPSAIKISSFDTDIKTPCYTSCDIKLTAEASSSEGDLTYKFTVIGTEGEAVISEGSSSSAVWVPTVEGEYTLKLEVTDTAGNYNAREISYTIKNADTLTNAFIKAFSNSLGTTTQLQQNTTVTFTTDAIGGNTGTKLLFYKYEITDPDGEKNIAYYTTSNAYSYTPTKIGTYTIQVSVQASDNSTVKNKYTYECVAEIGEETEATSPTDAPTSTTTSTDPEFEIGDVNYDNEVDVNDVTAIQKYLAKLDLNINTAYADVNGDGTISIRDATYIQLKLAKLI